jgi:hypothetical protein
MLPPDPDHLRELIDLGLVEMRDDVPAITNEGHAVLDKLQLPIFAFPAPSSCGR